MMAADIYSKEGADARFLADTPAGMQKVAESPELSAAFAEVPKGVKRNAITGWWHVAGLSKTADNTALIDSYLVAARAAGGGVVALPEGAFPAEPTMRHRVILRGVHPVMTKLLGVPGSSRPGVVQFEAGYNQYTWIENVGIESPNAGQHGIYAQARPIAPDNNGGWWMGGLRNVTIRALSGPADCIHFTRDGGVGDVPHQFLEFENVYAFRPAGGHSIYADSKCGQFKFFGGQFDGPGSSLADMSGQNIRVVSDPANNRGAYQWAFYGTTFQQAEYAGHLSNVSEFSFHDCYFESCQNGIFATNGSRVSLYSPRFANVGHADNNAGALVNAQSSSTVKVFGGTVLGSYDIMFREGGNSRIQTFGFTPPTGAFNVSAGATKQVSQSSGEIQMPVGTKLALVNSSATPITKIGALISAMAGDEVTLVAYNGPITLSNAGVDSVTSINLSAVTGQATLTIPERGMVRLMRSDAVFGWVVTAVSMPQATNGAGGQGAPLIPGNFYAPISTNNPGTVSSPVGAMRGGRLVVGRSCTLTSVGIEVTSAGSAGALIRLGLYRLKWDTGELILLADAGTVDASTAGFKSAPVSAAVKMGDQLLLVAVPQGAGGTLPTVRSSTGSDPYWGDPAGSTITANAVVGVGTTEVTGALPTSFAPAAIGSGSVPRVVVRASA